MRKYLFPVIMLICMIANRGYATDYNCLLFKLSDNTELTIPTADLEMTYQDGNLLLTSQVVNETISLSSLKSMQFISSPTGIEGITASSDLTVYNADGIKMGDFRNIDEMKNALPHGIYFIKQQKQTIKIIL